MKKTVKTQSWKNVVSKITFDSTGLVPAIVQDHKNGRVLMVAYMNKEALRLTLQTRKATYWSRSRRTLWVKGETSGHVQRVKEIFIDCDADTVLLKVDQRVAACHEGYRSCFFRKLKGKKFVIMERKIEE